MSSGVATTKPSRPPKPPTRSSLRQSLNFSSVGKALADVINKEPRDNRDSLKKSKDSSTRRHSLMTGTAMPHATVSQKPKSPTPPQGKEDDPTNKTITTRNSRRHSTLLRHAPVPADELGVKCTDPQPPTPSRRSTLRPRNANGTVSTISSALPKYRPKSVIVEPTKKPLSPVRVGTRRRFSTSEEDDGDLKDSPKGKGTIRSAEGKGDRPISPLPHRALAVKVSLPSPSAPSTPTKSKTIQSSPTLSGSPARAGSARPTKTVKTNATSSPSRIPTTRPSSSASSCSSSQHSPLNTSSLKKAFGFGRSNAASLTPSSSRTVGRQPPESPLARHSRQTSIVSLGGNGRDLPVKPPQLEVNNEDSVEADDVELLLAPVASLAAPTPAIPRIQTTKYHPNDSELQTPSRPSSFLPTRANLSYLSPLPPTLESSPALRPKGRSNDQNRGSIFSWEQVASENTHALAHDELESRLADIPAPFTPGGPSPNVSSIGLDVPETPDLSALPSPIGYGSISQVLLPDVTPSPAIHHLNTVFETSVELPPPADGTITLLRLQIAQAESIAKERFSRLQELEDQLHAAKQYRIRETEELAKQISFLEQQLHANVEARERVDEERATYTTSLQDQLRQADSRCEQAEKKGFEQGQQAARLSWDAMLAKMQRSMEATCAVKEAACLWSSVKDQAVDERDNLRAAREMLNVFMAVLDHNREQMQAPRV